MLFQIVSFLLDIATGLLAGACLLRLYMQYQRIPFGNPIGRLVFALSDWIVLPLRRAVPPVGRWDLASLLAAFLLELAQYLLLALLLSAFGATSLPLVPGLALFGLLRLVVSGLTGLLIVYAIMSWVGGQSPLYGIVDRLCAPPLAPIRRVLPPVGGLDLSPLVLLVVLQVASIVLNHLQASLLR
ncbi:YggT family protein [Xylophilus sp.]|uniref:YggT family protein n=1 Tax=Xylophilus sp. TaxID=2653893 RepID=UPI0013B68B9D|nr:YggT family protein [Xylophilus sp.]KAF1044396.1 MAG: hypothetical protein GAK38_03536 [Xylophilus sp.]